ncbi:putative Ig domain-containing protein [Caulobacter endophyticus]|nr:putative Ig domain-containing protein [Caulobacter endophyticus]
MNAVAFSGAGGDRLLVLGGSYTTSGSYSGSSNAIVAKLNEYVDATAPDPAQTTLLVNGASSASAAVGGTATIVVTTKLTSGAALTGATVTLSGSPSNASSISPSSATSDGTGKATFTVTGLQSGTVTYSATASANGTTTTSAGTVSVTYTGVRSAAQSTASVPNGTAGAATTIVITVRDSGGAVVTGAASGLAATIGGTNAGATVSAITDNGNGTYSFTYTPASAGVDSVAITLDSTAISGSPYSSTVSAPAIAITTTTLPTPVISVAYSQTVATSGGTAPVAFSVSAGSLPTGLSLAASTGVISGTATTAGAYSFTITATDNNSVTATRTYTGTIGAALAITTATLPTPVVGVAYSQTVATSGGTTPVTFSVSAGALPAGLSLAASTGVISGTATTPGTYSFTITATDNNSVTDAKTYTGTIGSGLAITTATLPTPVIGVAYSQTVATSGGTAPVTFSVSAGSLPAGLSLAASTGVISGTATTPGAYSFTITATDNNSVTDAKTYTGTIGSGLAITTATLPTPVIGVTYSQTVATSGGTAPVTFSVSAGSLPAGLSLAASTGVISGTATTPGAYSFTITATDNNSITDAKTYTGTIGSGLAITTATLPTPVINVAYSQTVATSGGTAPVTFSVSAGALPAGLSLATSTGVISGTATTPGAYSFTITATDNNSVTDAKTYTGTIGAGLAITTATLPTPVVGVAFSQTVATSGGTAPVNFTVSAGSLPAGLSLAASTGVISGTATTPGAYSFTITATDTNSVTDAKTYTGTIGAGLAITTTTLPTPVVGVAYSQTIATSGGAAPVTFAVSAGTLPAGLSLAVSTGVISGTATAPGAYSFTITATDNNSVTDAKTYTGTIGAGLAITNASLPTPVIGVSYSQTVATSGGTAPVTFAVSGGSLPAGLSLVASTGVISGTATTPGAYSFTITATDNNSVTATRTYTGTIGASLSITTTSLPTPVVGVAYSQTVTTSGGTAPVTFAASLGSLPAGLSLNTSTGVISGTATTPGAYGFTITATDNNGITDAQAYSGSIGASLSITTTSLPAPLVSVAYGQAIGTSGGTAPVTFAVAAGSLPGGLTLNTSTGVISGTATTPGAYSFTITATDGNSITASQTYSGAIGARLAITNSALATPVIGAAYSQTVGTSGGTAPVTFSVSAGALPAGLSLDAATGAISGAATTSGPYSFTITATDSNSVTDAKAYSGTINERVSISGGLTAPLVGEAVSAAVSASGGTGPYAFAVSGGALPAGLSLSPTGQISGTPTTAGPFSVTIEVTDANGQKASITLSGTVGQALVADDQSVEVAYNGSVSITLASLGADDTIAMQSGVSSGKLTVSGAVATYEPTQGYIGPDGFSFSVKRGGGSSRVATVKIKVLPPPPPTAESPSDQTLDTTAEDDAAVVVDQVSFDLASLVKGIVTDVRIETLPKHGNVEMVRAAAAPAAATTGARMAKAAAAAPAPAFTAVYTADKGYVGRDSFTFVAIGPGGVSAPALVNIEVVKSKPSAPVLKVSALGGRKVVIDLTAAALDGPFTGAALLTKPADSVGTARLVESGTAGDRRYSLEFTSKGATTGEVRFTYTLTNSSGVSDPLTVILTIEARPDPTLDTGVRAISDAQTEAARRFASTQMDNFSRRLERLHGDQRAGGLGVTLGSGVAGSGACAPTARTPEEQRLCRDSGMAGGSTAGSQGPRGLGEVEVWSGGAITVGRRDPDSGRAKLSVQTSGVSGGADVRVSPALTVGLGGGYASDVSKLGQGLGRVEAKGWTAASYASFHPSSGAFIDAVAGIGDLTFDTHRTISTTGEIALGQRDATLRFGALTAGYDGQTGRALWSVYLRAKSIDGKLKAYAENGSEIYSLAFDQRDLRSRIGVVGGRLGLSYKIGDVVLTPRVRLEYAQEFAGIDPQRIRYADWLDGAVYELGGVGWKGERVNLELGAGAELGSGWTLDLDVGGEKAGGLTSTTGRIGAAKRF